MRVVFIGTGEIGLPTLRALESSTEHQLVGIVTQPDKPVGRTQQIQSPPIKSALIAEGIPILQPPRLKDPAAIDEIRQLAPDAIVVMAYGQILPPAVLEIPRFACLNLHASLLPRWRGAAPVQAAIAADDRETGITVMYMSEGLDTGDILLKRETKIVPSDTGGSLHDRLGEIAPNALLEALRLLSEARAPRVPQNHANATYAPKLQRDAGEIDWSEPAEVIERKIRAFNPWPGTFTTVGAKGHNRQILKIHSAVVVDLTGAAGKLISAGDKELVIAAGSRALSLQDVQLEGKRRMSAQEFVRGFDVASAFGS
jgi:methionyl-tRNA formyltransferase